MDAGKATISGVFNGSRLLEIPFYQRAYVWGEEQWERFLGDMEFVTASKRPYFLGSIILKQASSGNTWSEVSEVRRPAATHDHGHLLQGTLCKKRHQQFV